MSKYISYPILFWVFWGFSFLGVLIEGIFCLFKCKRWETHTVTIYGPFCIIYGLGAVGFYIGTIYFENIHIAFKFLLFSVIATLIEYICGLILRYGLQMKAWDYSKEPFNLQGIICIKYTVIWGLVGILFSQICVPYIKSFCFLTDIALWNLICLILSIIMSLNLLLTFVCIVRWARRHRGLPAKNTISRYVDKKYGDDKMSRRFCEWKFIES